MTDDFENKKNIFEGHGKIVQLSDLTTEQKEELAELLNGCADLCDLMTEMPNKPKGL